LLGDGGNDFLIGVYGGDDRFEGGSGTDTVSYFGSAQGIQVYLKNAAENKGAAAGDVYDGIEVIDGTFQADILEGNGGSNAFWGANGADALKGHEGNDTLKGGDDNDTLTGGIGSDTLNGDNGFDWVAYDDAAGGVAVSLIAGTGLADGAGDALTGIEGVIGSSHGDTLTGTAHSLRGLSGNDTYHVTGGTTVIEVSGQGTDTVIASGSYSLSAAAEVEVLKLASAGGTQAYALTGSETSNTISGNAGANSLNGQGGHDTLFGGAGKDVLNGGAGKDVFAFDTKANKKTNLDKVADYSVKDDTIWLENKVFTKLGKKGSISTPAKLGKAFLVISDKAKDKDDYLIYDKKKGVLYYDADGSGKGKAVEIATLTKNLKMTAADFFVI
jgi:Ca2+-binding RTX toxin-like protein